MSYYVPKIKYPVGTKVYVSYSDILVKGIVLKHELCVDNAYWKTNRYFVKLFLETKDGFERGFWFLEKELSPLL